MTDRQFMGLTVMSLWAGVMVYIGQPGVAVFCGLMVVVICCAHLSEYASAIEARRAETLGSVHESAVAKPDAQRRSDD